MKNKYLATLLCLAIFSTACKSDKKADASDNSTSSQANEESAFREATLAELTGDFADPNYPDKGFWKKFTVKQLPDSTIEVSFTSAEGVNKQPACTFSSIAQYYKGYLKAPVNPGAPNPTYLTIRYMLTGDIFVGAEGGDNPNPSDVLKLFCMTSPPTSLGGLYEKRK